MAQRSFHGVQAPESKVKIVTGEFTTNSTSDPTVVAGAVSSVSRDSTGQFSVTLKDSYNACFFAAATAIGTAGMQAHVEAADIPNKDITIQLRDATDAAADTTGEVVQILLIVRNSALNVR